MKCTTGVAFTFVLFLSSTVWADVGVFTGTGQNLRQISTESVQLVSIDVTIVLGRGRFLFDGSVPGMDEVEYDCRFVLRNLTDKACDIKAGFPIDSQFARVPSDTKDANYDWVSEYSFNARDEKNTYHVTFQFTDSPKADDAYSALFTWMMSLQAKETRTLTVQYRIPMSMTLASTSKRGIGEGTIGMKEHPWMELLGCSGLEVAGYTTETGSTWAGNVEKATFTVDTGPFEKYLDYRGFQERKISDLPADQRESVIKGFPVHYVWVFRDIKPLGWQPMENGLKWEYKNYKPKDPITVSYYLIQFPQVTNEVNPWVDVILQTVPDPRQKAAELAIVRQILLATYGQEPSDKAALKFAQDQIWYAPKKDFALSNLTADQQAVLAELDRRLESIQQGK